MHLSLLYHLSLRSKIDIKYNREIFYLPALIQWENKKNGTHPLKASYHPTSSLLRLPPLDTQAVALGVDGLIILNIDDYFRCHLGFLNLSESTFVFLVLPPFMFQMFQKLDLAWLAWVFNSPNDPCSLILDVFNRHFHTCLH